MTISKNLRNLVLYVIVLLSGCAGLIYEVVWHRYLAILLGAQARATAIVLAIFLGGISAGYHYFGKWSRDKRWNLLLAYCIVEVGLALWAFCFPYLFKLAMPLTSKMYAVLGLNSILIDLIMSTILIGFPTFLMGGTLPLLTQALSNDLTEASKTHAKIYGFNTLGAGFGCLLAGYYLIPHLNLPVAITSAGMLNAIVALVAYFVFARSSEVQVPAVAPKTGWQPFWKGSPVELAILAVGFLSGFYLITLQTVIIRLVGLATGAANYNFTLVVSIFIFGLGSGSLLARRIEQYTPSRLFWNQIAVSLSLLFLYLSGNFWSYGVHIIRVMFRDMAESFYAYQLSLGIAFALLLAIPIGFSGLSLPLCFHLLRDRKETLGHRVGQLYGLNTVGCVFGAILGGYLLLNYFDLDQLFKLCIICGLATVGIAAYIYVPKYQPSMPTVMGATVIAVITAMGAILAPRYSYHRWVQPFRHPQPTEATWSGAEAFGKWLSRSTEFLHWKDGPNTSVGIGMSRYNGKEASRTIFVNGKSDGNTRGDYFTTVMLAHIPALLAKKIDRTCVIGFGTGITIGTLSLYPEVKQIDVAEISPTSIETAHYFDPYNNNVSKDPKVRFNEMDAFRLLEGTTEQFDLIVSEPSNPWVAGIENLYSSEFYEIAKRKMTEDGLFVQWIHTYSFNDDLFRMVLRTMSEKFPYVSTFQLKGGDLALVGRLKLPTKEEMQQSSKRMETSPIVKRALAEAGIKRFESVLALELIPWSLTRAMAVGADVHNLESPRLSNEAAKAFFVGTSSRAHQLRRQYKEYFPSLGDSYISAYMRGESLTWDLVESFRESFCDHPIGKTSYLCEEILAVAKLINPKFQPPQAYDEQPGSRELASLEAYHFSPKTPFDEAELQKVYSMFEVYKKYASPVARIPLSNIMSRVEICLKVIPKERELWGECLLQKILTLETVSLPSPELYTSINHYLDWFPSLKENSPNYNKLLEAKEILSKMAALQKP